MMFHNAFLFPEAVLLDWDNTLINSNPAIHQAVNSVFREFGRKELTFSEFLAQPTLSIREYLSGFLSKEQLRQGLALYARTLNQHEEVPFADAVPLLSWLYSVGVPMAVVSNKEGSLLRQKIQDLGWTKYFYCVLGANDTLEHKPSPIPLLHALSKKSIQPGPRVWFAGDSIVDMLCAHRASCTPVAVGGQAQEHDRAQLKVKDLKALLSVLHRAYEAIRGPKKDGSE